MKTTTALVILCLFATSLFALFSFTHTPVTAKDPYILIEVYEVPSYPDRGIHIHYGGNKREFIPFKSMTIEDHDEAGDLTLSAINKLVDEGYQIEHTAAGLAQSGMITKIFMRKK